VWNTVLGTSLGNYRVVEQLGEGGMGVVYIGRHETLGRRVVVKVLQPELSRNAEMVQRFFNEAQAATEIRNPGIVQVFDFGTTADGRAYFVMELLEGETLSARLRKRRHDAAECCRFGRQVANVLQAAHAKGITHRDLKPENLFLVPDDEVVGGERVKVLDFGIAKLAGEAGHVGVKTHSGLVMGTPDYMSPEQCRSASTADARSDIYSLGCILFELACGRPPFVGPSMAEIIAAHLHEQPPNPLSVAPDLVVSLASLITHMLAKRPDARPQTMAEVSRALDHILRAIAETSAWPTPRSSSSVRALSAVSLGSATPTSEPSLGSSTPQAWSRSSPPSRASVRWLPALLGAVVISVAATAIAIVVTGERPRATDRRVSYSEIVARPTAGNAVVVEPPPSPPTPAPAAPVAVTAVDPSRDASLAEAACRTLEADRKWTELVRCAEQLKPLDPARAEALTTRAIAEIRSAPRIAGVTLALRDHQLKRAKAELDQVWTESVAYPDLKHTYDLAEAQAISELAAQLGGMKDASCDKYHQILAGAANTTPPRVTKEAARRVPCTPPPKCNVDDLSEKARVQFRDNQYATSLALYEAAYACKPTPPLLQKAFIVACNLRDLPKVKAYWKRLSAELRTQANGTCVRNGITVEMLNEP
jgi:serine/threonine protein kinase